mgnify:CR=1 FL=1
MHVIVAGGDEIVHNAGAAEFCDGMRRAAPSASCGGPDGGPLVVANARHELMIESDAMRETAVRHALKFFGGIERRQN